MSGNQAQLEYGAVWETYQADRSRLEQSLHDAEARIAQQARLIADQQESLERAAKRYTLLNSEHKQTVLELINARDELSHATCSVSKVQATEIWQQSQLAERAAEIAELCSAKEHLQQQLDKTIADLETSDSDNTRLQREALRLQNQYDDSEVRGQELSAELEKLKAATATWQKQLAQKRDHIALLQKEKHRLEGEVIALKKRIPGAKLSSQSDDVLSPEQQLKRKSRTTHTPRSIHRCKSPSASVMAPPSQSTAPTVAPLERVASQAAAPAPRTPSRESAIQTPSQAPTNSTTVTPSRSRRASAATVTSVAGSVLVPDQLATEVGDLRLERRLLRSQTQRQKQTIDKVRIQRSIGNTRWTHRPIWHDCWCLRRESIVSLRQAVLQHGDH